MSKNHLATRLLGGSRRIPASGSGVSRQRGLTLIEVLIALLVLSIGLAGIAALHLTALRNVHSSYHTSIASSAALDLEERLWLAASDLEEGCLSNSAVLDVINDLVQQWSSTDIGRVAVPELVIDPSNVQVSSGRLSSDSDADFWTQVSIAMNWSGERFGEGQETFRYATRVICSPVVPDDDDDEND